MASFKERIIEVLRSRQLLEPKQLEEAIAIQQKQGGNLQQILVERGYVQEADLLSAVGQGLGIPPISLARMRLDIHLKGLIPRELALQYQVVPISCIGQTLTVAMADPLNVFALDTLITLTGLSINPMLASSTDIREAINQFYGTGFEESLREVVQQAQVNSVQVLPTSKAEEVDATRLLLQTQEAPVVKFTDAVLTQAVHLRASDLFIEPREKSVRVRYRVDGVLQEGPAPPKSLHAAVVSRIKVMSELNIAEYRLPQDGHFNFNVDGRVIDFRVSVLPSCFGGNVCLRVLDRGKLSLNIETLGFSKRDLEQLKNCASRPHGLLLSTGPTGSGKTTSLYALLKMLDTPDKNLVTVEDPVEYDLEGINQVNVRSDVGLTFASALRAILRQDPNVIMVGEIRDGETADMAVKAALTGHMVLSTLHTNNAAGSVVRLINMGVEPFLISSCLTAVVGQRLVRKVCVKCIERYRPPKALAEQVELLQDHGEVPELVRGKGCRACFQSGYMGREVIAETLAITSAVRELILRRAPEREIEEQGRKDGMKTLREQGITKALSHITTLEEIYRTTVGVGLEG